MNQGKVRYEWNKTPWRKLEKVVQKRIYRASQKGDVKLMHRLQKLLLRSASLKMLAVRRVTQDNKGKRTAGVDGVARLTQKQRLLLVKSINLKEKSKPLRRTKRRV